MHSSPTQWGAFNFRLFGNHLQALELTALPGAVPISMKGQKNLAEWQRTSMQHGKKSIY
jgi:hypothetical protein